MALAIVVHVEQSSYRRSGARMLITADGHWIGGISGGCLEGDVLKKASYAIHNQQTAVVRYDTREDDPNQIGIGLGCNGLIDIVIIPIQHGNDHQNPVEILSALIERRVPSFLITNLESGETLEAKAYLEQENALQSYIKEVEESLDSKAVVVNNVRYFIEVINPEIHLLIFGSNYDIIPLLEIAKNIGWKTTVISNSRKISKLIFELSGHVIDRKEPWPEFDNYTVPLIMSHDYNKDLEVLSRLDLSQFRYVGLLGPNKRKQKMIDELDSQNQSIDVKVVYGPMGLDTGAYTPEEIAISILAEIRTVYSNRGGGHLRERGKGIYEK